MSISNPLKLFQSTDLRDLFAKKMLLIAFFWVISFNSFVWAKSYFLLGQASFYFVILALLARKFWISKRALIFISVFVVYCLSTAALFCLFGQGLCTSRPYSAILNVIFLFLTVECVSYFIQNNPGFDLEIEKYIAYGAWTMVLISIPDIYTLIKIGNVNNLPQGWDFFSQLLIKPYYAPRLRGLTQEPSYLGMVIATIYPICFFRLNQKYTLSNILLVIGLWICLIFSMSRVGLLSCCLLTFLILMYWPKRLFIGCLIAGLFAFGCFVFQKFYPFFSPKGLSWQSFFTSTWFPSFGQSSLMNSSLPRMAHIIAALNAWSANPFFGVGLGQSGYVIPSYYPAWYGPEAPEYDIWVRQAVFGGVPSFSFLPKLLSEIGLLGAVLLFYGLFSSIVSSKVFLRRDEKSTKYFFAFFGFLIASFGVDGYLYLSAWLVFGVLLGLSRIQNKMTEVSPKTF